ncbi:hypothetical protein [Rhodanobacter sp. UC4436_H3]
MSPGTNVAERCSAYRTHVEQAITRDELNSIRLHLQRQHTYGTERFREAIEAQLSRRAGPAKIGRPRKSAPAPESAYCPLFR